MRRWLVLAAFLFLVPSAFAQTTNVTATITDAGGQGWFNGNWTVTFNPAPTTPAGPYFVNGVPFNTNQTYSGALSGLGAFSVVLTSSTAITPTGSKWTFTVCPAAFPAQCFSKPITVTGVTQNLSTDLSPPAISIPATTNSPRVNAYADSEITGPLVGFHYFNLLDQLFHVCASLPCGWNIESGTGNAAIKPAASNALCFATPQGIDTNDGLSWGSSKLTIQGCYDEVPSTGGAIYYVDGVHATPTAGQGIWLMGPTDPNYALPPAGWRHAKPIFFYGPAGSFQGTNAHYGPRAEVLCGSSADRNHPCVWLSGVNTTFRMENTWLQFSGRNTIIGECSDNTRTGTCTSSGWTFENTEHAVNDVIGQGPAVDVTGFSFWGWFIHSGAQGTQDKNGATDNKSPAWFIDGTGNSGMQLIFFKDVNTENGGIKILTGTSGSRVYVDGITCETMIGTSGCVQQTSTGTTNVLNVRNAEIADQVGTVYSVEVDGSGTPESCKVDGGTGPVFGPCIVENILPSQYTGQSISPLRMNQGGVIGGIQTGLPPKLVGRSDAGRRLLGVSAVISTNLVSQKVADWTVVTANTTLAGGQAALDGTSLAGKVTVTAGTGQVNFYNANQTYAAGDYVIGGVWVQGPAASPSLSSNNYVQVIFTGACALSKDLSGQGAAGNVNVKPFIGGDGQREWFPIWAKISSSVANPCATVFSVAVPTSQSPFIVYAPILLHIATGAITDNEAAELASSLGNWPKGAVAGDIAALAGHNVVSQSIEKVRYVDQYTDADVGAKINSCEADLPATGGTCDASALQGAQTISTVVTISKPMTLKFGYGTYSGTKWLKINVDDVKIQGAGMGKTILQSNAAIVYAENDIIIAAQGGTYPSPASNINRIEIYDLTIDGNQTNTVAGRPYANDTHGNGINLNRCNDCKVMRVNVKNVVYQGIVQTGDLAGCATVACAASTQPNDNEIAFNILESFGEIGIGLENHTNRNKVHDNILRNGLTLTEVAGGAKGLYTACIGCIGTQTIANQFYHNHLYNMPSIGINVQDFSDRVQISHNDIHTANGCIRVNFQTITNVSNDTAIEGNECYDSRSTAIGGIDYSAGTAQDLNLLVVGNLVDTSQGGGITINGVERPVVATNRVRNVGLGAGAEQNGIALYGANTDNAIVSSNDVSNITGGKWLHIGAGVTNTQVGTNASVGVVSDSGTATVGGHNPVSGTCTLGTNCAVTFVSAFASAPACVGTDTTAIAAVKVVTTTTTATFTGTGTDVIAYVCLGNPN